MNDFIHFEDPCFEKSIIIEEFLVRNNRLCVEVHLFTQVKENMFRKVFVGKNN